MLFNWIKIIHIISACVLFGVGLGTAFYLWLANKISDTHLIYLASKRVVKADWIFTGTSAVIQPISGFAMIVIKGYPLMEPWVVGSVIGYVIAGMCWLPVVYLQIICRDLALEAFKNNCALSGEYRQKFKAWFLLGIPAFLALLVVFYLMTVRPSF